MEAIKIYKVKDSQSNLMMILGSLMLLVGIISGVLTGHFTQIGFGILFLVLGAMQKGKELVKFNTEYMELKPAPLAATQLIRYTEIDKIEEITDKKIFLHGIINGKQKRLRLPVALLTAADKQEFLQELKTKMEQ